MSTRPKEVDQSGWTALPGERKAQPEQPERKKRRTEDEPPRVRTEAELATHEFIRQHNEARRGESLMDAHARAYGRGEAASASAAEQAVRRGFDRERDVVGRRVDAAGRRRMLEDAARLGGRFSHGSRGDFL
ncbi:hypothetical protein HK405_002161 [Cladochytrium tenue]|nr:hypothetical protein HK405_002161 [Cladochytrium tenue]